MRFFDLVKTGINSFKAAQLPPVPLPKAPKGVQAVPGDRTNIVPKTSAVARNDRQLANTNRLTARDLSSTAKVTRELVKSSPDLSAAVSFLLRTGIPEKFTNIARDMDGNINVPATQLAQELLRRLTYLGNVDGSFGSQMGLQSLSEQLGLELIMDGAACLEVALDKARIPASLNPVSVPTLKQYEEENSFRLVQVIGGIEIDLDLPTIIYTTVDQFQSDAYPSGYIESSIQPILADIEFNNDMRRVLKRAVLPRMAATIDFEKVKKMTPPQIMQDPAQFATYLSALIAEVQSVINGAAPEDAFVTYDCVTYSFLDANQDPSKIVERIQSVLNGKLASGAKTLPVILGHGTSSNASSTEALLYLKQADMLRRKLNEMYSRALTVAIRLMGQDCYVEFEYAELDLRPDAELEAFKAMKQSRVLDLLSLGMLTDEESCIMLTGNLPPAGYKPLTGTMFRQPAPSAAGAGTPGTAASNTSALGSDAPKGAKSQNNKSAP